MDPFVVRMLERCEAQRSKLPKDVAEKARLRERQLLDAYYTGLQQNGVALRKETGPVNMRPAFKVPTTGILGFSQFNNRPGKENKSPTKEIQKASTAGIAPRSTVLLYPRRPPRSVYNSPLIQSGDEGPLIFEKRYKSKNIKRVAAQDDNIEQNIKGSLHRGTAQDDKIESVLSIEQTELIDSSEKVLNAEPQTDIRYPSLPKINTSYPYDLEQSNCGTLEGDMVMEETLKMVFEECRESRPESSQNDLNICTGGVKKLVEMFSQSPLAKTPRNSPSRISPKFEKFNRSPLATSTVNSPIQLVVPKLYHILEPSTPEFRDIQEKPFSNVENQILPTESEHSQSKTFDVKPVPVEDFDISMVSSDSVPVQTSSEIGDTKPNRFLSLRQDNTQEKYRRPVLDPSMPFQISRELSPTFNDRVKRLTLQADIQRSLVTQTSKALCLCRSVKQFKGSRELVEGERILLLASLRCQAAQEEIKKCALLPSINSASRGSVTVSDIFVPLKWDVFPKLDQNICSQQWFLCVLTMGESVQATEAVQLVGHQPMLKFRGAMQLSDLSCDFRARLQLYAFRLPQYSTKGKSKIVRACKMLRRPTRTCLGPAGSSEELLYIKSPAFTLIGYTELTVGLIGQIQPVSCSLEQVPMVSLIKGTINFRLSAELIATRQHSGFLNVLRPAGDGNLWQRWWCHLDGKVLCCWNYPSDQEEKLPVFSIDLLECLSEKVVPAPRVLCSRPRTLMLESQRCRGPHDFDSTLLACSPDSTIVRHFISCDTAAEMTEWSQAINECLQALRVWNTFPKCY